MPTLGWLTIFSPDRFRSALDNQMTALCPAGITRPRPTGANRSLPWTCAMAALFLDSIFRLWCYGLCMHNEAPIVLLGHTPRAQMLCIVVAAAVFGHPLTIPEITEHIRLNKRSKKCSLSNL